jgi:uncharacterized protein (TIGR03083 family)
MAENTEAAAEWRAAYDRVVALAETAGDQAMTAMVPATPDWTARDLLSHMIGVGVDSSTGNAPDEPNDEWTQGHVDQRAEESVADLLAEWDEHADDIEEFVRTQDPGPLGDVIIHEQDLRGALQQAGARDTDGLAMVREVALGMVADGVPDGGAPLALRADDSDWSWTSGEGEDPGAVVVAPLFDLTRAITSRRTADQLRAWTTTGDLGAYADAFAAFGPLPTEPLPEDS